MVKSAEDEPPSPSDLAGWRETVADGSFLKFRMEAIVAAVQDLGPNADTRVLNPLLLHLSDVMTRFLRRKVGRNHHNEGEDIIQDAYVRLIGAVLDPKSNDGRGLRAAFYTYLGYRAADAIRKGQKAEHRECEVVDDFEVPIEGAPEPFDPREALAQRLDVESVLDQIRDHRKRLAFRLYMDGIPLESKRSASIAAALGVSSRTAGQWINEVRAQLRNIVGEKS